MMILDGWQTKILETEGDLLLCTGRRVGKTTIFAIKAAERMVKNKGTQIVAVSLTEDQAFLMHSMVLNHLEKNYKPYLKVPKKKKPTKSIIHLNNGSSYTVRPVGNTGDAIRGFNASVLISGRSLKNPKVSLGCSQADFIDNRRGNLALLNSLFKGRLFLGSLQGSIY